jgi:CRISPR-associated protein Csm5
MHGKLTPKLLSDLSSRVSSEGRLPRNPGRALEEGALGVGGADGMRLISASDSGTVQESVFKIFLLRASTLEPKGGGKFDLAWKQIPGRNVKRLEDSTPVFAEMAVPGTSFEGGWREKAPRNRNAMDAAAMLGLVTAYTEQLLKLQKQYAEWTGLAVLKANVERLEAKLGEVRQAGNGCVLPLGWSAGFLSKVANLDTSDEASRQILRQVGFYAKAIQSGLPFPKTRKIVFLGNQPATIAGFVHLEII